MKRFEAELCEFIQFLIRIMMECDMPGGLLFLFDRNKLRYFRKDGHNWRKKKDGKTIREAHEKLKVGFRLKYMLITDSNHFEDAHIDGLFLRLS